MTDAAQVEAALKHFPCGPGAHSSNAGLLLGGFGTDVGWIPFCEACGKRDGPMNCLFCDEPAGRSVNDSASPIQPLMFNAVGGKAGLVQGFVDTGLATASASG